MWYLLFLLQLLQLLPVVLCGNGLLTFSPQLLLLRQEGLDTTGSRKEGKERKREERVNGEMRVEQGRKKREGR